MWNELADEFSNTYHCPTGVRISVLDYFVDESMATQMKLSKKESFDKARRKAKKMKQWRVRITLIGDPASAGAIVNSPFGTSRLANCKLETCRPETLKQYLRKSGIKIRVSSTIVTLTRLDCDMDPQGELLIHYDESEHEGSRRSGDFWSRVTSDEGQFCDRCFSKRFAERDGKATSLVCCSGSNCLASRHYGCFEGAQPLWSTAARRWYCPEHQQTCFELPAAFHRTLLQCTPPAGVSSRPASSVTSSTCRTLTQQLQAVDQSSASNRRPVRIPPRIQSRLSAPSIEQCQLDAIVRSRQELCRPKWLGIRAVEDLWLDSKLPCPLGAFNDGTEAIEAGKELLIYGGDYALSTEMTGRDTSYTRRLANTGSTGCIDGSRVAAGFVRFTGSIRQVCEKPSSDFEPKLCDAASAAAFQDWLQAPRGAMVNSAIDRINKVANCKYGRLKGVDVTLAPVECIISTVRIMPGDELCVSTYNSNEEKRGFPSKASTVVINNRPLCQSPRSLARFQRACLALTPPSTPLRAVKLEVPAELSLASDVIEDSEPKCEASDQSESSSDSDSSSSDSNSSDVSRSDASGSDSSSSDSESEAQSLSIASSHDLVTNAGSKRSTLATKSSILSIPRRKSNKVAITDEGLVELRAVWKEFGAVVEAAAKKKNSLATWHHTVEQDGSAKEKLRARSLASDWASIKECCGSTKNLCEMTLAGRVTDASIFDSMPTLLRARLKWFECWSFDKQNQKQQLKQMLPNKVNDFRGFPLCNKCLIAAVGISRATAFRLLGRSDFHVQLVTAAKHERKGFCLKMAVSLLRQTLETEQQHLPTGSSGQTQRPQAVLSYTTQQSCRHAIEAKYQLLHGTPIRISKSTFHRALKFLADEQDVRINVKKQKLVARCSDCCSLEGAHETAKAAGQDRVLILSTRIAFQNHLVEAFEQRAYFDEKKAFALRWPWLLWTLTLDGFDQSKTRMPSIWRGGKAGAVDRSNTLGVRVVGAFVFGAPVPCIGMSSFEDIPTKGGDASVTCLEKILDTQWEAMDVSRHEPIPYETPEAAAIVRHSQAGSSPLPPVNPAISVDFSVSKAPFLWPQGLHVTFDNAGSDCKNRFFFRFLAALVGLGVFEYITISTLLVGHTHDIVDQMFGAWANELRRASAPSIEAMHRLFREKYSAKIYVLQDMLKRMQKQKKAAAAAAAANDAQDASAPAQSASSSKLDAEELTPAVADYLVRLSSELGVQPQMILMQFTVDVTSWAPESIANISVPHCFLIQKEQVPLKGSKLGDVEREDGIMMYSRFLAQSWKSQEATHTYPNVRFGPWTTRKVLMRMSELPRSDPFRYPPQYVDVRPARACMLQHVEDALFDKPGDHTQHQKEFTASLDRIAAQFENLDDQCNDCAQYQKELNLVGPIHRPTEAEKNNPAIKQRADEQHLTRETLKKAAAQHLASTPHDFLLAKGWWTKWIDRVNDVIRPYYIKRRIIAESDVAPLQAGRLPHPREMPRDKEWTAPIWRIRVAEDWAAAHPPPNINQIVAVRGDKANEPFWLGKIVSVPEAYEAQDDEFEVKVKLESTAASSRAKRSVKQPNYADHDDPADEEEESVEEEKADSAMLDVDQPIESKAKASKPAAAVASTKSFTAKPKKKQNQKLAKTVTLKKQAAAAPASKSGPARAIEEARFKIEARRKSMQKEAASAAAESNTKNKSGARSKATKLRAGQDAASNCRASDQYQVFWFDYKQDSAASTRLMPLDMDRWTEKMTESGCLEEWKVAVDEFQKGKFARVPEAALRRWQDIEFLQSKRSDTVSFEQLIFWASKDDLLTKDGTVRAKFFSMLVEDLSEASEVRHKVRADYVPKKAAAEAKMEE